MQVSTFFRSKLGHRIFRPGLLAAGIALVVTVAAGGFAEHQNLVLHHQQARADVGEELGRVRARLEANINSNIQLVRGLVAVIAAEPDIDQQHFSRIAAGLMGNRSQLRNIAAAPDLVIRMMYPVAGNEKAIGLDYRKNDSQREAALRAVETRNMVLAGPIDLLQGGRGFVGRFPVFVDGSDNSSHLWGLVSAVIDVDRLYGETGLLDPELPIDIAISGKDANNTDSAVFFGAPDIFERDPVVTEVTLPSGSWRLAAVPRGGWSDVPANLWRFRFFVLLAGLVIVLPILVAGNLYDQRRVHIRELRRRQVELQKLSQRLKLALDTSKIGIWELNLDTMVMTWDDRMKELYDIPADVDPSAYDYWSEALHPDDLERAEAEFETAIVSETTYRSEFRVVTRDGTVRWIRAIGTVQGDAHGGRSIIGVNWDVSADIEMNKSLMAAKQHAESRNRALENARAQMEHNSLHDSLTGLPNRRFLDERLLNGRAGHRVHALLHIDLDRFKQINDTLGHAAGDAMLVHAASVLKASIRSDDFVARIGGDEFVVAVTSPMTEQQLSILSDRIVEELRQPVPYKNHLCRFGVSIGVAIADGDADDNGQGLLIDADIALYRAKNNGRGRHEFFSQAVKAEIVRNKRVADDILNGLDRGEFLPHFQPQFDARTLDIAGVEALARWDHPREGVLGPDQFLKIADELNVVPLLDRTILEQSLWHFTRWKAAGLSVPHVSVNVSAGQLHDADLIRRLDGLPIEPGMLSFELLESTFMDEGNENLVGNVERLKELGIDIEIDDFGTGYASIISLIHLRPSRLKVDRRLITPIVGSEAQRRLVSSIIEIGQSLGISVVAEGVETMEHAAILRDLGCDTLQGYAFAAPMPAEDLMEFVRTERWRKAA